MLALHGQAATHNVARKPRQPRRRPAEVVVVQRVNPDVLALALILADYRTKRIRIINYSTVLVVNQ
jgi:hypothetical protein